MTLGELIRSKGLKQRFVCSQLNGRDIEISESHFSQWCTAKYVPKQLYIRKALAELLGVDVQIINQCLTKKQKRKKK